MANSTGVDQATGVITELLHLRSCRFERRAPDRPFARIEGDGHIVHAGLSWPVESVGIPGPEAEILAQWRGRVLGRFALTPTPGMPVQLPDREVAVSLATVVGAALSGDQLAG